MQKRSSNQWPHTSCTKILPLNYKRPFKIGNIFVIYYSYGRVTWPSTIRHCGRVPVLCSYLNGTGLEVFYPQKENKRKEEEEEEDSTLTQAGNEISSPEIILKITKQTKDTWLLRSLSGTSNSQFTQNTICATFSSYLSTQIGTNRNTATAPPLNQTSNSPNGN